MDRSTRKNNLIANTTGAPVCVFIAKDLQSGEKDGTLDLIKNASRRCRRRFRFKTCVATVAIKLLNGLHSLPSTVEKDGSTTENLERERSFELNTYDESSAAFIFSCIPRFIASHSGWCIMHLSPVRVHLFRVVRVTVVCS